MCGNTHDTFPKQVQFPLGNLAQYVFEPYRDMQETQNPRALGWDESTLAAHDGLNPDSGMSLAEPQEDQEAEVAEEAATGAPTPIPRTLYSGG